MKLSIAFLRSSGGTLFAICLGAADLLDGDEDEDVYEDLDEERCVTAG
jgi:hypothetical protein